MLPRSMLLDHATPRGGSPAAGRSAPSRFVALDALRGLAAVTILVFHVWLYTTTTSADRAGLGEGVLHELRLALPLFFVLSGFLLYRGWVAAVLDGRGNPNLRGYCSARVRRLVPGAWLCLAICVPLLVAFDDVRGVGVPDLELVGLFAIFGQALHPDTVGRLNPPMWTLTVEAAFYLLLPLLGAIALRLAGRARSRPALLVPPALLAAAGTAFNIWLTGRPGSLVAMSSLLALAPLFAAGMTAAVLVHRRTLAPRAVAGLALTGILLVLADGWWHESGTAALTDAGQIVRDLPAGVGFALLLAAVTHGRRPPRLLAARPLEWLGERSYGVYLWHMPAIYVLRGVGLFPEGRTAPAALAVLAVCLPIAHLSWTRVERPLLRTGGSAARGRTREPAPGPATPARPQEAYATA